MTRERTLLMYKPDVYVKDLADTIEKSLPEMDLHTVERFVVRFEPAGVFHLWPRIYGRVWTTSLMRALPSRPLDVVVLEGDDAIVRVIDFKDRLRESASQVNSYRNLLHSPDSSVAFEREHAYLSSLRVSP